MKIGFVVDDSLDKPDGVQQYVLTLSGWLREQGHEVHYLVGETKRTDLANVHSLSKNIAVKFNRNRLTIPLPSRTKQIKELLDREQFDVLHVQMPHNPFLAAKIVRWAPDSTAIVGTFHIAPYSKRETAATRALGVWLKRNLERFDQIVSVSPAAQAFAKKTFMVNTVVVPNVVDIASFQATPASHDQKTITFLGRLVKRKGCDRLLYAITDLEKRYQTKYHLRICGDGEERENLEELKKSLNIQARIDFRGFVSEKEKRQYLAGTDIAVFPATGGESFGIVLIEAMAAGARVVLAGDNPGYRSVMSSVPEALFDPFDESEFADKLHVYLSDIERATALHRQQQELVKQYDVNVVGPKILNVYKDAIVKRRP